MVSAGLREAESRHGWGSGHRRGRPGWGEEEEQVRVRGGLRVGGCTPPSAPSVWWLLLGEGGERPGTRRRRRGMEEAAAAAAAADVIWSWAEQVMEKGIMTPEVGSPRMGS